MFKYSSIKLKNHRLIPSRYPTVSLFDWAESAEELEQLALLEGLTNDRLKNNLGQIRIITKEDWIIGEGATPLMAAFTHIGFSSRFTDGSFGIYYAASSLEAAVSETKFHRERFMRASNEPACLIQMREYISYTTEKLVDISHDSTFKIYLDTDVSQYHISQKFGRQLRDSNEWGIKYPSVRHKAASCYAILRPKALTIPTQGCHLNYIWDGQQIVQVKLLKDLV